MPLPGRLDLHCHALQDAPGEQKIRHNNDLLCAEGDAMANGSGDVGTGDAVETVFDPAEAAPFPEQARHPRHIRVAVGVAAAAPDERERGFVAGDAHRRGSVRRFDALRQSAHQGILNAERRPVANVEIGMARTRLVERDRNIILLVTGGAEEQRQRHNAPIPGARAIVNRLRNRRVGEFEKTGLNERIQPLGDPSRHLVILVQTGRIVGAVTDQQQCGLVGWACHGMPFQTQIWFEHDLARWDTDVHRCDGFTRMCAGWKTDDSAEACRTW